MTITIAGIAFDYHDYDARSDVLFLHVGKPSMPAASVLETAEGHTVEYDDDGTVVGLELNGVRAALDSGRDLQLTWPPARRQGGSVAPEWALGFSMGLGGFAGSYAGARLQSRLPETSLRRLLGLIACLVAARYTQVAIQQSSGRAPAHAVST